MRNALLLLSGVLMAASLWADDLTRAVQQRLKDQGFYYGEVDGQGGDETSAAIRRYQIRYGLKVTGELNEETLHSLGMSRSAGAQPAPGYQKNEGSYGRQPEDQYYQQPPRQYYGPQPDGQYYQQPPRQYYGPQPDDQYYQQLPRQYYGRQLPPPEGREEYDEARPRSFPAPPVTSLPGLFAGTIYEQAPAQVQENVLYAVQGELMKRGFFRGIIDGRPGPATSDAILRLQQEEGLPMSGRLDNETLNDLRAFPGQRNGPRGGHFQPRFFRGYPEPFRSGFSGFR